MGDALHLSGSPFHPLKFCVNILWSFSPSCVAIKVLVAVFSGHEVSGGWPFFSHPPVKQSYRVLGDNSWCRMSPHLNKNCLWCSRPGWEISTSLQCAFLQVFRSRQLRCLRWPQPREYVILLLWPWTSPTCRILVTLVTLPKLFFLKTFRSSGRGNWICFAQFTYCWMHARHQTN